MSVEKPMDYSEVLGPLCQVWSKESTASLSVQAACKIAISRQKLKQFARVVHAYEALGQRIAGLSSNIKNAKEQCMEASENVDIHSSANAPLERVAQLQAARDMVRFQLRTAVELRDLVLPDPEEASLIQSDAQPALASKYLWVVRDLLQKKDNTRKLIQHVEKNGTLTLPLASCIERQSLSLSAPSAQLLLIELDEALETATERLFVSALQCCQQLIANLFGADGSAVEGVAEHMFSIELVREAKSNPVPKVAEHSANAEKTGTGTQGAQESILNFYRTVFLLQTKPRYLRQSIKAVATLRHRLLTYQFLQALHNGPPIFKPGSDTLLSANSAFGSLNPSVLPGIQDRRKQTLIGELAPTNITPTEFFGSVLSWVYQAILDERAFAKEFLGSFETLGEFEELEFDRDEVFTDVGAFLNFVTREGLLPPLKASLKPYCPFDDFQFVMKDFFTRRPVTLFEVMYSLDFYIQSISAVLCPDEVADIPLPEILTYLVHLREGFFVSFKSLLDSQALQLQDHATQETASPTMRIPPYVMQAVQFVKELFVVFDQQLIYLRKTKTKAEEYDADEKVMEFNEILNSIYNPVINLARSIASRIPEEKSCLYTLNCFSFMLVGLTSVEEADKLFTIYSVLESLTEECLDLVIDNQTKLILERIGMKQFNESESRSEITEMELIPMVQKLYTFAASSNASKYQLVSKISSKSFRQQATRATLQKVADAYDINTRALLARDTDSVSMVPTSKEIRELLRNSSSF